MKLYQCLLEKNRWYRSGSTISKTGIVVHSSGANNPTLKRYVQPVDGQSDGLGTLVPQEKTMTQHGMLRLLGTNTNENSWNREDQPYGMHAFVGKLADGSVAAVQTLPWDRFLWGCGSGRNGSYNSSHIQFEICEDTTDGEYTKQSYRAAAELCAWLCREFDIPVNQIVSHNEAGRTGYASTHVDPEHWWCRFGYTMGSFRADVQNLLDGGDWEVEAVRCNTIGDVPEWGKDTVRKLLDRGLLQGDGTGLGLTWDMLRILVILDRTGVFDKG